MSNFQTLGSLSQSKLFALLDVPQEQREDLIETNIRQRGDVSSSSLKMGRIIQKLEEIYGVKKGSNQHTDIVGIQNQESIAKQLGISTRDL